MTLNLSKKIKHLCSTPILLRKFFTNYSKIFLAALANKLKPELQSSGFLKANLGKGVWVILHPRTTCLLPLNNSEMVKAVALAFCSIVSNFVYLTRPSLHILGKTQMGVFLIADFLLIPYKIKLP